ncbi:MAG: undecaprenyl/decaprenyl-phosphate alpha-N-acetylglucosaminyl 1-phosphate transferase [Clostridiales bacterium]|jgi:UDP-GlcNAc:undecaprenyl-phosphate GlcNAc-1-phosphate transferase|nr:undecaprenyl/decaprenyl-phosphate alpha-N-acetylglucosaminyl 1-phosphate transferase [Clostridiales bacterium]
MNLTSIIFAIVAVVCAALISYTVTPPVRLLAFRIGAVDIPTDARRMHKKPTPRIGGLGIFIGFTVSTLVFCDFSAELFAIWTGGAILVILGILDDILRLSALLKLLVQICAAGVAVCFGVVIDQVTMFGTVIEFGIFAIPITLLWIVGLSNAINLIDGLDGLACGVSAITSLSILGVVLITGDMTSALITAILVGACGGFLPYNKNPASIFMGDTGALFLGYTLAIISVQGVFKLHTVLSFLVPLSIFALPLLDTLVAICRRLIHKQSPFHPDRGHLHHKLVDMGFTHKEAVRLLYAISGIMGLVAVTYTDAMFHESRAWKSMIIAVVAIVILVLNFLCLRKPSTRILSGLAEHISEKRLEEARAMQEVKKTVESKETEEDGMADQEKQSK